MAIPLPMNHKNAPLRPRRENGWSEPGSSSRSRTRRRPQPGQIAGRRLGLLEDRPQDEREDERDHQVEANRWLNVEGVPGVDEEFEAPDRRGGSYVGDDDGRQRAQRHRARGGSEALDDRRPRSRCRLLGGRLHHAETIFRVTGCVIGVR